MPCIFVKGKCVMHIDILLFLYIVFTFNNLLSLPIVYKVPIWTKMAIL